MNTDIFPLKHFTTHQTKPSRIRAAEDEHIAATLAKQRDYAPYVPSINPWLPEDTIRHDRVRRNYERLVRGAREFEHLCAMYGYDPSPHTP